MSKVLLGVLLTCCTVCQTATLLCRFNREGDLLISCAKVLRTWCYMFRIKPRVSPSYPMFNFEALVLQDHHPTLWFSDDGYRVGTYNGHNGAVWTCDITCRPFRPAMPKDRQHIALSCKHGALLQGIQKSLSQHQQTPQSSSGTLPQGKPCSLSNLRNHAEE